ncbi:MAG: hypothetical protein JNL60_12725 [Bacteroidia bacterium]|nr:hypothetical protein [Bacteroidia bacterium]
MKTSFFLNLVASASLAFLTLPAAAQDSYTIKMSVKVEGMPAEYAAYGEQEVTTYIKGNNTKTEISSMMFSSTVYYNETTLTSLSETMGNKTGYTATKEELEGMEKGEKTEAPKVEYFTDKKTIAGFECTKAVVTSVGKDKKETKTTVWITDKISLNENHKKMRKATSRGMDLGDLKGYPLAMEANISQNGMDMKMVMTATEVSTAPIPDATFIVNTEGYKMMSYKEAIEMAKSMRSGK